MRASCPTCCCASCCATGASCACISTSPTGPACWPTSPTRIADAGGNVIEVKHQQLFAAATVQSTELHLMVEVRDRAQGDAIIAALAGAAFTVKMLPPGA